MDPKMLRRIMAAIPEMAAWIDRVTEGRSTEVRDYVREEFLRRFVRKACHCANHPNNYSSPISQARYFVSVREVKTIFNNLPEYLVNEATGIRIDNIDDRFWENIAEAINVTEIKYWINKCLTDVARPREKELLRIRFGIGGGQPMTFEETAAILNITRGQVFHRERIALLRLGSSYGNCHKEHLEECLIPW